MIKSYRKKPVVVQAIQWTGQNYDEICDFTKGGVYGSEQPASLDVHTLEGTSVTSLGDYIVKGTRGELRTCKPDIFYMNYEEEGTGDDICLSREAYIDNYRST